MRTSESRKLVPALLLVMSLLTQSAWAYPLTYEIGAGTASGFSGSWLHAGTTEMGSSGYFANGEKISISGSLTIDWSAATATGMLSGSGDFGLGTDDWRLIIDGMSSNSVTFVDGNSDLLSLDYVLESLGGNFLDEGTFYFAARDFNGGTAGDGPNHIDDSLLYLWGNNWLNANGSSDRDRFINAGGTPLGLDLYGIASVAEPPVALLLGLGLVGIFTARRLQRHARPAA